MTQQRKPEITRQAIIVVDLAEKNQYGDLIVTDKDGKKYKVSKKRERLYPLFAHDTAVELSYAVYNEIEYIADAILVGEMIESGKPAETGGVGVPTLEESKQEAEKIIKRNADKMTKEDWSEKDKTTRKSIERQVSLKAATEFACALIGQGKEVRTEQVVATANVFEKYLEGE